jgi:hypothetical protein
MTEAFKLRREIAIRKRGASAQLKSVLDFGTQKREHFATRGTGS